MIYFTSFAISAFFFWFSQKKLRLRVPCLFLSVLILAFLAGVRDYSVGTDVNVYGLYAFQRASSYSSIFNLITNYNMDIEFGYAFIAFIVSRFSNNPHLFFFIIGIINYGLIAYAIYKYHGNISPWMAWMFFFFLFFSDTFNIMRQTLALAFFLVGFSYVQKRDYKKTVLFAIASILFHSSAILGVFIYFFYSYISKRKVNKKTLMEVFLIATVCTFLIPFVLPFLLKLGILPAMYSRYIGNTTMGIAVKPVLVRLIPLAVIFMFWDQLKSDDDIYFLLLMLLFDMLAVNLSTVNVVFERIGLYFGYFRIFAYSKLFRKGMISIKSNRLYLYMFFLLYCITLFTYQVIYIGGNQVFPYTSIILGI